MTHVGKIEIVGRLRAVGFVFLCFIKFCFCLIWVIAMVVACITPYGDPPLDHKMEISTQGMQAVPPISLIFLRLVSQQTPLPLTRVINC